jgi:hypothetical protein
MRRQNPNRYSIHIACVIKNARSRAPQRAFTLHAICPTTTSLNASKVDLPVPNHDTVSASHVRQIARSPWATLRAAQRWYAFKAHFCEGARLVV